jgi:signal transduction histidine kinase
MNSYGVTFSGVQGILIRKITPQILFSSFLTLLTMAAFYLMYRNLKAQQRLMQIKNDFISNVTHELKTPVATVSVALEALKNFNALEDQKKTAEYLEIAQNELNRLTLMTDKILKTAVYEDQGIDLRIEHFDVDALIQQVLSSMKLVFEKRKTKLVYTKQGTSFMVAGSQTHITNVLYNLVDNGLKYGGDDSYLAISLMASENEILLSFEDKGIGIAPEYQKKIFEKFFRVPSGDVHNTKGHGLGLSYVASVVRSHQGKISVESEPGKGSVFTITLPVDVQRKS